MRYAILGDVHANLEALTTVVELAQNQNVDRFLQLGDIVGYGADPVPCIKLLRDLETTIVAGNHDWAVTRKLDTECFNPHASAAVEWTRTQLSAGDLAFLEDLPLVARPCEEITLVHATLDQPELFDYVMDVEDAIRALQVQESLACFSGHSHIPVAFVVTEGLLTVTQDTELDLTNDVFRALINVGSVGQPRDEDHRAAVAVFDTESLHFELHRIEYDYQLTAAKIRKAGLPAELGERLYYGQ